MVPTTGYEPHLLGEAAEMKYIKNGIVTVEEREREREGCNDGGAREPMAARAIALRCHEIPRKKPMHASAAMKRPWGQVV